MPSHRSQAQRTQAVAALSSAESELYAIGAGATEALHVRIQDVRLQGKLEQRFLTGVWLGKDTQRNESILGIPEKYNKQLMDTINVLDVRSTSSRYEHTDS